MQAQLEAAAASEAALAAVSAEIAEQTKANEQQLADYEAAVAEHESERESERALVMKSNQFDECGLEAMRRMT